MFNKLISSVYAAPIRTAPGTTIAPLTGLEDVFGNVVSVILGFGGIGFFVMFIVGGFKLITGSGNPKELEAARNTLTFAIAGLVLTALAYLFLVVIARFTGVDSILNFKVGI